MRACCTYASCDKKTPVKTAEFSATPSPKPKNRALHLRKHIYDETRPTPSIYQWSIKVFWFQWYSNQTNVFPAQYLYIYVTSYLLLVEVAGTARFDDCTLERATKHTKIVRDIISAYSSKESLIIFSVSCASYRDYTGSSTNPSHAIIFFSRLLWLRVEET